MTTTDHAPKRSRTDWDSALQSACAEYEATKGRRITARTMTYPASPVLYVQVDDTTPVGFASAKDAAIAVGFWSAAP